MQDPLGVMIGGDLGQLASQVKNRAYRDLYFAATAVWGFTFFDAKFHRQLASFMGDDDILRKAYFAPRGSGKTSFHRVKCAMRFLKNSNEHQLLPSYDFQTAAKNLNVIHSMIAGHRSGTVAKLWPEIWYKIKDLPTRLSDGYIDWNKQLGDEHPDPTFKAIGVNSGVTGGHYPCCGIDDLIDEKNARSPSEVERAYEWFQVITNCLEHQNLTPIDLLGTRYGPADTYQKMRDDEGIRNSFKWFIHPMYWSEFTSAGKEIRKSYWPSKFPVEMENSIREQMGSYFFEALMQQRPIQPGDAFFKEDWIKTWEWHPRQKQALLREDGEVVYLEDLVIGIVWDPALGGPNQESDNALIVIAQDFEGNYYVLDTWAEPVSIELGKQQFARLREKWNPNISACEAVLFQQLIYPSLRKDRPASRAAAFDITPVKPAGRDKDMRIQSLQPILEQGRLYVHKSSAKLRSQIVNYRVPELGKKQKQKVDLLDCLAYAPEVLWQPETPLRGPIIDISAKTILERGANKVTGY